LVKITQTIDVKIYSKYQIPLKSGLNYFKSHTQKGHFEEFCQGKIFYKQQNLWL